LQMAFNPEALQFKRTDIEGADVEVDISARYWTTHWILLY